MTATDDQHPTGEFAPAIPSPRPGGRTAARVQQELADHLAAAGASSGFFEPATPVDAPPPVETSAPVGDDRPPLTNPASQPCQTGYVPAMYAEPASGIHPADIAMWAPSFNIGRALVDLQSVGAPGGDPMSSLESADWHIRCEIRRLVWLRRQAGRA